MRLSQVARSIALNMLVLLLVSPFAFGISVAILIFISIMPESKIEAYRLTPGYEHKDFSGIKSRFIATGEISSIIPYVRLSACLFSRKVIGYRFKPAMVDFPNCGQLKYIVSEDLAEVVVYGSAKIMDNDMPFTAVYEHDPNSINESGLILAKLSIR